MKTVSINRLSIIFLLLLGTALRLFRVADQSMWFDEVARLFMAQGDLISIWNNVGGDTLPPLFHFLTHGWALLGIDDFWLRIPSVYAGVLLIALVYRIAIDLFDSKTAVIAATATAILPYLIYQSQQANLYSLVTTLAAFLIFFFLHILHQPAHKIWIIGYIIVAILGIYTHYFLGLTLVALHLFVLLHHKLYRPLFKRLILSGIFIVLLSLPLMARFLASVSDISGGFRLQRPNILTPLLTFYLYIASYSLPSWFIAIGLTTVLLLIAFTALQIYSQYRKNYVSRRSLEFLGLLVIFPIAFLWLVSQVMQPVYIERGLMIVIPASIILFAYAIATSPYRSPLSIAVALTLLTMGFSLFNYYTDPQYAKPNYRAAAAYMAAQAGESEPIIHLGNSAYVPFLHYLPTDNHYLLEGDPRSFHPAEIHELAGGQTITDEELEEFERIWLLVALDHSIEYQQERVATFDAKYTLLHDVMIDDLIIRQYALK